METGFRHKLRRFRLTDSLNLLPAGFSFEVKGLKIIRERGGIWTSIRKVGHGKVVLKTLVRSEVLRAAPDAVRSQLLVGGSNETNQHQDS